MPAKSPQVENVPKTPEEITPPAWAFDLKQQLNEIQQQQAGLVDVDTLEKRMDKLSLTVENLVEKLEHDTEVGQKEDSGNGYDSGTGASKGSTSGKDSNSPRNCGHDVNDKIDIIKISKRAANLAKLENGVYKGVGDKRGYLAFKREVLSKPEFEFADSTSEISCALLYFYVLDNITAALQQLVSTRCRKQNCSTFVERVVVLWDCLGEYSDLDDQMALIRRWEGLSCGPGGSAQVDSFISDLEGVKEQLESIRGMPLTDVECRSRLYSGLPSEGKEYLDSLSLESVATYADMLKETRRWAQLDIRYHSGTTTGIGSRGSSGKATSKSFSGKGSGTAKTVGNKTAQSAELYNVESIEINENLDDSVDHVVNDASVLNTARSVFLTGLPRNWSWSQVKELASKLLGHVVEVFVTLLSSPGAAVLRFNSHDDAVKFMEACQGSRLNGRHLRCHFDKFERPVDESSPALLQVTAESVEDDVDCDDGDAQLSTDNSELECQATVLDHFDSGRLISNVKESRFDDQVKQSAVRKLTVSTNGLPHLCISLGHIGYKVEALVDTGASDVFIARDLVNLLRQEGEDLVICHCDIGVNMVDGTNCGVLGIIYDVPVAITTELVRHVNCYVLDNPRYKIILPKKVLKGCMWLMSSEEGKDDILLSGLSVQYISTVFGYSDDMVDCNEVSVDTGDIDIVPERIEVDIPWKSEARPTPNYKSALHRGRRMVARLLKDKQSYEAYEIAVKELLSANVVEVYHGEDPSSFASYYMNVVPVIDCSRVSTRCRLCLDARFINTYMFNCPPGDSTDSMNLWRTLMKWRSYCRVSAEDLSKAFWQVCINGRDKRYLGLLLPLKDRVVVVRWARVPFGTNFSPWALSYAIRESLFINNESLPIDYYVDDLIIFGNEVEDVEASRAIVEERLAKRGFLVNQLKRTHNLLVRGEAIGEPRLLSQVAEARIGSWLGYRWFIDIDTDVMDVKIPDLGISDNGGVSLDTLRSVTARLYDPLGLLSEVTLQLICMMKYLHEKGYGHGVNAALGVQLQAPDEEFVKTELARCCQYLDSDRLLLPRFVDIGCIWAYADASETCMSYDIRDRVGRRVESKIITSGHGSIPLRELESLRLVMVTLERLVSISVTLMKQITVFSDSTIALHRLRWVLTDRHSKKVEELPKPEYRRLQHICDLVGSIRRYIPDVVLIFQHVRSASNLADRLTRPGDIISMVPGDWELVFGQVDEDPVVTFRGDSMVLSDSEGWDCVDDELSLIDCSRMPECALVDTISWYPEFRNRVLLAQSGDSFCVHVAAELRSHTGGTLVRSFALDSSMGLLLARQFRKDGDDDLVPVIPNTELQEELIDKVHLSFSHPGISRMVKLVRRYGWFKGLYCAVKRYVLQCSICAQVKEGKMLSKAMGTIKGFIPMIWGVVGLDLFGPIRLQNQSKCWVLIAVCYITRLVAIRVVGSPSAADVVAGFVEILAQEGIPRLVVHDQVQCFMATSFKDVLARYHIVQAYANSYDAAQRGWIERCHAEFGALLRATKLEVENTMKDMNDVRKWCSLACFTMNCLPYSDAEDSRLSPWLCCRASRGLTDCILGEEPDMVEQVQDWLGSGLLFQDLTDNIKRISDDCQEEWARSLSHSKELWLERRAEVRRKLSRGRRPHNDQLKVGDTVWKRNYAADKLSALFIGPYVVTTINGANIGLKDSDGVMSTATVNQLKKGLPPSKRRVKKLPSTRSVTTQVEKDDLEPELDAEELRKWRDTVTGSSTILTRSRKRLLEKVDSVMSNSKVPKRGQ